ncbi:MAG: UDP-N-acetylmuramoyl-L-alanine--D-glutamate ligase [Flavobacteriales bacterium]|nr:UDP-N-acetylmuramoyl-L-alanine--D-glutamate ligase [Flavobacteriales bacterium]
MAERLVILGGGESGAGAAYLGQKKGYEVFLSDKGKLKEKYAENLRSWNIDFEEGVHTEEKILNADLVIKSPGIPETAPLVQALRAKGVQVVSEIEFGMKYTNAKTIGITGTNGKTTTTLLTHHMLAKAGLNVGLAGNVGKSLAWQVADTEFDYIVLELSSFQLDDMFDSRINLAVLMNITPDHLDRYRTMEAYIASKMRITQNQTEEDAFIYCADDANILAALNDSQKAKRFPFTLNGTVAEGAFIDQNNLNINLNNSNLTMSIHELALQGKHNSYNSMAAGIVGRLLELRKETVRESLSDFSAVEHRLEPVGKVQGIEFINDSKATNINSTWYALECMNQPVIWIVGGVDKGNDYSMVAELVKDKVKAIICLGTDNEKIHKAFEGIIETIVDTQSAQEAVKASYYLGKKGDAVLLSPACASFDLFENYEDRGRQFKAAVRSL